MIKCCILSLFLFFSLSNLQTIETNLVNQGSQAIKAVQDQPIKDEVNRNKDYSTIYLIVALVGGFLVIILLVYSQQKRNLKLQQKNSEEQFKLTIYRKIDSALELFFKSEINTYLKHMKTYLDQTHAEFRMDSKIEPISSRLPDFLKYNEKVSQTSLQVYFLLESWEIISPQFKVFCLAINSALYDLNESFAVLYPLLLQYLPVDLPIGTQVKKIWPHVPNEEQLEIIQSKIDNYLLHYDQLSLYMHHIKITCQNNLLDTIFQNKIEFRKALNPKLTAINFDTKSIENWITYFENETAWGKSCKVPEKNRGVFYGRHYQSE